METDRKWVVVRIDGKIAAISTDYRKLAEIIGAMTCVECGIDPAQVDTEAICQGYRLAFPENAARLDRLLKGLDEYSDWG